MERVLFLAVAVKQPAREGAPSVARQRERQNIRQRVRVREIEIRPLKPRQVAGVACERERLRNVDLGTYQDGQAADLHRADSREGPQMIRTVRAVRRLDAQRRRRKRRP